MEKSKTVAVGNSSRAESKTIDFRVGKSRKRARQNKGYLELLSVVSKSRAGLKAQQAMLTSKPAKHAANLLDRQLDLIFHMVFMPYMILMAMEGYAEGKWSVAEEVLGITSSPKEERKRFQKISRTTMERFFALDAGGSLSRPWLSATTVYMWTAFECLAGDLWTSSLDQSTTLGHQVLGTISGDDPENTGLSRRRIDVGLAARYGFDLRRKLGTILRPKFDFTSVEGVQSAYKKAFGTCGELEKYSSLKDLEQVRHLIVHRGGIADDQFMKVAKVKGKPGRPLFLTMEKVTSYMVGVTLGCVALLKVVDEWFGAHQTRPENHASETPRACDL
jgi:hypothetical protein